MMYFRTISLGHVTDPVHVISSVLLSLSFSRLDLR